MARPSEMTEVRSLHNTFFDAELDGVPSPATTPKLRPCLTPIRSFRGFGKPSSAQPVMESAPESELFSNRRAMPSMNSWVVPVSNSCDSPMAGQAASRSSSPCSSIEMGSPRKRELAASRQGPTRLGMQQEQQEQQQVGGSRPRPPSSSATRPSTAMSEEQQRAYGILTLKDFAASSGCGGPAADYRYQAHDAATAAQASNLNLTPRAILLTSAMSPQRAAPQGELKIYSLKDM